MFQHCKWAENYCWCIAVVVVSLFVNYIKWLRVHVDVTVASYFCVLEVGWGDCFLGYVISEHLLQCFFSGVFLLHIDKPVASVLFYIIYQAFVVQVTD